MSKKASILLIVLLGLVLGACGGCKPNITPDPDFPPVDTPDVVEQPDLSLIKHTILVTDDWIYSGKPAITFQIENPNKAAVRLETKMKIVTDSWSLVTTVSDSVEVAGNSTQEFVLTTADNLEPGFYRATCTVNGKISRGQFVFGIDPFDIVSPPDKQPDYDEFWATAKQQLASVDMQANLIEIPSHSTDARKVYLVELFSIADGLEGAPVKIRGYYCEPQDGQRHPVIMHFYGYDTKGSKAKCECPSGGSSAQYAEFYLSHRGQYLNNRPASTGNPGITEDCLDNYDEDWFAFNFGNKDGYYYRGAFMDCVQAVNFMATRPTSDMNHLFAEGSSQGGALTYAAAALSDYPFTAIAANVAFLGDFADAMDIGGLAAEISKRCKGSMTREEMLAFLSYFDTKNLATRISCPVLASSGLQDDVCPPRTNVVPFNNLATPEADKEYIFGPLMGHSYPGNWNSKRDKLFKSHL